MHHLVLIHECDQAPVGSQQPLTPSIAMCLSL